MFVGKSVMEIYNVISVIIYCMFSTDNTKRSFRCFMGFIFILIVFIRDFVSACLFIVLNIYIPRYDFSEHIEMHINYELLLLSVASIIMNILYIVVYMITKKEKRFTIINFPIIFSIAI